MTNHDLFRLLEGLRSVGNLPGVKFSYAVAKNIRRIEPLVKDLEAGNKPSEIFEAYEKERGKLLEEYAQRDDNNRPVMIQSGNRGQYQMEDQLAFEAALEALDAKHPEAIDEQKKRGAEFETLLEEKADEVKIHTVKIANVPEGITAGQMTAIFEIIDDAEEPKKE